MRSVRSLTASGVVAWAERRLFSAGGVADAKSSPAFAVKPASAVQEPELDAAPPPTDEVAITGDAAVAQTAQATSGNLDGANEAIPLAPADYDAARTLQAARAYAQTMQALSETKAPRPPFASRPAKPDGRAER
jgi:hypothetical protein